MSDFEKIHATHDDEKELSVINEALEISTKNEVLDNPWDREEVKDYLYDQFMKQKLIDIFFDDLSEYIDDPDSNEMRETLLAEDDASIYAALSLPYELRKRKFKEFKEKIEMDGQDASELMKELVELSKKYGFGVGYHTSPAEIRPNVNGEWSIKGTEPDHRDNDVNMAYYSTKYRHIFRKKNPRFIYIVRTDPSTHKGDGVWSRAGSLSVVGAVPFSEVNEYMRETLEELKTEMKKTATQTVSG